ncbi:hypothetical protein HPS57_08265 [Prevotella sp. PINT]|jgi:hypothetical protein|uniref:hypothetical protein n=1 Tax=Palleniella intestinalis TaxID=2736291 RepID=UPI00155821AE|nr:hypothetical protein [Palleniella intestinalis]NPD81967.1 hypothetical protein [Palleniella intestinalis]
MKKSILAVLLAFVAFSAKAENGCCDKNLFNHLGVGVEVGTTGIGFNLATPIGNYVQMRAGMSFLPTIKVKDIDVDFNDDAQSAWNEFQTQISLPGAPAEALKYKGVGLPEELLIDGKISMTNFKLLFDLYPSKHSSFHFTAGFYAGKGQIIEAYTTNCQENLEAITYYNNNFAPQNNLQKIGVELGDYLLEPNGSEARAYLKTSGFKPYLGIGSGRAVPRKRVSFAWDLGVQFWGTPKIYMDQPGGQLQLQDEGIDGDGGKIIKTISKITVYPCLSFRINGRIF